VRYGLESEADITTKKFQLSFEGLSFTAQTPNGEFEVKSRLVGRINVYNLLAAIGAAQALGFSNEIIQKGIENLESVSGRFQRLAMGQPFLVIVDYAHTDDALENLIRTARELHTEGRIITLFGCGGLKDRTKRPVMGEVAGRLSDLTILSSDNPRKTAQGLAPSALVDWQLRGRSGPQDGAAKNRPFERRSPQNVENRTCRAVPD